ncbi:glycosyltransferase family 39 protein [Thalassoglobus sp. JC818]|uniref:ArnT family glycosyltransferase n=1 Tax=Thalassoglobus sp. JC818 TaxID=3232136 RepID=UPI003459DA93
MIESQVLHRRWLIAILFVALVFRVGGVVVLQQRLDAKGQQFLIAGDAEGYWQLGQKIVEGEDYAIHTPPRYVHRMPGFPVLLAAIMAVFGQHFLPVRIVLAVIATLACLLVYWLGKRIGTERTGLIAAAIAAVSPTFVGFSGLILSETTFSVALLLASLACERLGRLISSPSASLSAVLQQAIWAGIAFGIGVYLKPSWILAAPLLAGAMIVLLRPSVRTIASAAIVVLAMVVSLLPWAIRNELVSGHFTLTTFWMGPSLYDGVQPGANGESDMRFFDDDGLAGEMTEYEVDQEYRKRSRELIFADPLRVAHLSWLKLVRYWNLWPNADQFQSWPLKALLSFFYLPVFTLSLYGAWVHRGQYWSMVICLGPVLYFMLIHLVFVSSLRYRLPGEYPMLVMTALGIEAVLFRSGQSRPKLENNSD